MIRLFTVLIFFGFTHFSWAQIVNIENSRLGRDSVGLSILEDFNFYITQNTSNVFKFNNKANIQYKWKKDVLLLINDVNIILERNENQERRSLESNYFIHLRYNHVFSDRLTWEGFVQVQENVPLRIDVRGLVGTGPRINLYSSVNTKWIFGPLLMYEYENELDNGITHSDFRISTYSNIALNPAEDIAFELTAYYQPLVDNFSDYRVSAIARLELKFREKLSLLFSYSTTYDSNPVQDQSIPNLTYTLRSGFSYRLK